MEKGEKCECFLDWPDRKSVADFDKSGADFCRTKTGNSDQKLVANFDNLVADFGLLSSSKCDGSNPFLPQNPNFDHPNPKTQSQRCS